MNQRRAIEGEVTMKTDVERRLWGGVLIAHGVIFTIFWILLFVSLMKFPSFDSDVTAYIVMLLWLPFLLAHVAAYFFYAGRKDSSALERRAYRDGFADGRRDHVRTDDDYDTRHLAIDDEGELVEIGEAGKRKRRLQ